MAASTDNIRVRWGGSWRIGDPRVRWGGQWRQVKEIWVHWGGSWRHSYVRSDPISGSFYPDWTNSYSYDNGGDEPQWTMDPIGYSLYQGDWDTVGHPSGMQRTGAFMRWDVSAMQSYFDGREDVTDIDLRLGVRAQYTSNGIHPHIWVPANPYWIGGSKPSSISPPSLDAGTDTIGTRTTTGNNVSTDLPNSLGEFILGGSTDVIICYDGGTDTAAKELYRGGFYDSTDSNSVKPYLTITADYET